MATSEYLLTPASELRRALRDTIPFAGKNRKPVLETVQIAQLGLDIVLVATDSYRMLVSTVKGAEPAHDPLEPRLLHRDEAKMFLKALPEREPMTILLEETPPGLLKFPGSEQFPCFDGDFPNWRRFLLLDPPAGVLSYERPELEEFCAAARKLSEPDKPANVVLLCSPEYTEVVIRGESQKIRAPFKSARYFPGEQDEAEVWYNPGFLSSIVKVTAGGPLEIRVPTDTKMQPTGCNQNGRWTLLMSVKPPKGVSERSEDPGEAVSH